ncbi:hypothetical protein Nepgr_019365 [Nepenthes gracilis]|uniref:Uncharacterized protein n=1 Tax=Nepenthes gracilis TaxID=150966 RepID=A0AAD3SVP8_NEPGR|nr:hypothetical protein Nepgr_019365 [Nepenthes gracilis]
MDDASSIQRSIKYAKLLHSDPNLPTLPDDEAYSIRNSSFSAMGASCDDRPRISTEGSPLMMSPWNQISPFYTQSTWSQASTAVEEPPPQNSLIGSLVREEGHIYSLATRGDLLYTGSDSKNIRVWKNLKEFSGFKSASGLVKAIVISGEKIFTGHQDGKIRVWKVSPKNPSVHKRSGSLPTLKNILKCSIRPSNYVEVKGHRSALWIKHSDAISCLSMNEEQGLLYSASWDRTFKVWRVSDSKCLESVAAHEDALNSVVTSSEGLVFTGSANGTVKVWRREVQTLLKQECAVTALEVDQTGSMLYCGSSDGLVNFWELDKNFAHGGLLRGHKLAVLCLAANGPLVFSGSADKNICVWRRDGTVHTCLSVLSGHTGPVKCLAVEVERGLKDPRWIVYSGSLDKSVKVWSVTDQPPYDMGMGMMKNHQPLRIDSTSGSLCSDRSYQ